MFENLMLDFNVGLKKKSLNKRDFYKIYEEKSQKIDEWAEAKRDG